MTTAMRRTRRTSPPLPLCPTWVSDDGLRHQCHGHLKQTGQCVCPCGAVNPINQDVTAPALEFLING